VQAVLGVALSVDTSTLRWWSTSCVVAGCQSFAVCRISHRQLAVCTVSLSL